MKTPESVLKDFLLEWDIEDYGTEYTVQRMIETLMAEGYKIVPKVDLRPVQQQPPQAWVEAKKEVDDGWPDK